MNRFFSEDLKNLKKNLEAEQKATKYMKASGKLWIQEFEGLKSELNKAIFAIDCCQ